MIYKFAEATDRTGASVRVLLLDYRKAFDLIDHSILVSKIRLLSMDDSSHGINFDLGKKNEIHHYS